MDISIEDAKKVIGKTVKFKPWCMAPQFGVVKSAQLIEGTIKVWISDGLPIGTRKYCPQWCNYTDLISIDVSYPRETVGGGKTPPIGG